MKICNSCNAQIKDDALFCPSCGSAVANIPPQYDAGQPVNQSEQWANYQQPQQGNYHQQQAGQQSGYQSPQPGQSYYQNQQPPYGQQQGYNPYQQNNYNIKTDTMCVTGFVLSLVSIFLTFWLTVNIAALVCSFLGIQNVNRSGAKGKGLAIAGLAVSAVTTIFQIIYYIAL